ncbi:MAG: TIGR02285 family protein [Gammaproteobacteria bacterium]|nr:TIGR02285 family protein [Gammaproteobacteria bacterium]MBU1777512.1 TIGR02285 family protein [Gammaproteobacteria bacterium]MBU1968101.1 TIGR02285 family protein [Gammaproteobacteria bacterium]
MSYSGHGNRLWSYLCAALAWLPLSATAQDELTWGVLDFPPFQILDEAHKGSGSFDGELATLVARMEGFDHHIVTMSFARRKEEFLSGANLCTPGIFKSNAAALGLAISIPALVHLDNRVIFLKDKATLFGRDSSIDLESLFLREDLVGAVIPGRSYAPNIDAVIAHAHDHPQLMKRPLSTAQLFQMLLSGDIDYLLLFPHEAAYLAERFGASGRIANLPINGTPPYIFTHVACSGNDWGRAMIARINTVIRTERGKPEYRSYSERWYPAVDQERIRGYYPKLLEQDR